MKDKGLILLLSVPIIMSLFFLSTYLCMKLKLNGEETMIVEYQEPFQDPGVVATIMGKEAKVIVHGKVNTNQIGTYELVYEMRNRIGMVRKKTRKVTVTSEEEPTITLKGDSTYYVDLNSEYIEPGYVAYDVEQQDITDQVIVRGMVNPKQFGIYVLKYEVRDKSGNEAVVKRKVIVKDRELPTLTLKGYEAVTIYTDETYEEPGFVATDNLDGDLTNHVIVKDNIEQKPGVYQVKYQVTDSSGNTVEFSDKTSSNISSVSYNVEVALEKEVELTATIAGTPDEGVIYTSYDILPSKIRVIGRPDVINPIETLSLGVFDITGRTEKYTEEINIEDRLPDGVMLASTQARITVEINLAKIDLSTASPSGSDNVVIEPVNEGDTTSIGPVDETEVETDTTVDESTDYGPGV